MLGDIQFALHKGPVNNQLRGLIPKPRPLPGLDLHPHGLEVPLHAVHSDREDVHEAQVLGVLGEHGSERACKYRYLRSLGGLRFHVPQPCTDCEIVAQSGAQGGKFARH